MVLSTPAVIMRNADVIIITDHNSVIRFVNPTAEKPYNRRTAELLDKPFGFHVVAGETTEIDIIRKDRKTTIAEMGFV
jgi:hypothetical protein